MINKYPYTNFNEYNLDWIIAKVKDLVREWAEMQTEWSGIESEFEDLKAYVDNYFETLDLQDEVNQKLDEMADDGTLEALVLPYLASIVNPSKTIQIARKGRFLDEFDLNSRNMVLLGQSMAYNDGFYYDCGDIGQTTQSISIWDSDGQLVRYKNDYTELYHANGIAVDINNIYIACQDPDVTLGIIKKSDLSVDALISFPDLSNLYAVTNYNDDIYFVTTGIEDGVRKVYLHKFNKNERTYETICDVIRPINNTPQGMTIYNDQLYLLYNKSNMIYRYSISPGVSSIPYNYAYYIPEGDGLYPCGECEALFVKDDVIYLYSVVYPKDVESSTGYVTFTQMFATDITKPLEKDNPLSYMYSVSNLKFYASSYAYSFNPGTEVTTLEELSALANYHKNATLYVNDIAYGFLYLKDGNFTVIGQSGGRIITKIDVQDCRINVNSLVNINEAYFMNSDVIVNNCPFNGIVHASRSKLILNNIYLDQVQKINTNRCEITINNIKSASINTSVTTDNAHPSSLFIKINTPYVSGLLRLLYVLMGSYSTSEYEIFTTCKMNNNVGFTDAISKTALVNAIGGTLTGHSLFNNTYCSNVRYQNNDISILDSNSQPLTMDRKLFFEINAIQ